MCCFPICAKHMLRRMAVSVIIYSMRAMEKQIDGVKPFFVRHNCVRPWKSDDLSINFAFHFYFIKSTWFTSFAHDLSKLNRLAPTHSIRLCFSIGQKLWSIFRIMPNIVPLTSATVHFRWTACIILNARQFFFSLFRHLHKVAFLREN